MDLPCDLVSDIWRLSLREATSYLVALRRCFFSSLASLPMPSVVAACTSERMGGSLVS